MKAAGATSLLLHALLLGAVLAHWRWQPAGPAEVPAKIELVFGTSAVRQGGATAAAARQAPAPASASASASASLPTVAPAASLTAATPSLRQAAVAASAATSPVRLGDGLVGFDVPTPDANIVESQNDPGNRPPPPPDAAFARGEHGRVILRIHVRPDGLVGGIDTLQSSGYPDLDDAAIAAARRWRFIPQLRDGEAVASVRDQPFDFELR